MCCQDCSESHCVRKSSPDRLADWFPNVELPNVVSACRTLLAPCAGLGCIGSLCECTHRSKHPDCDDYDLHKYHTEHTRLEYTVHRSFRQEWKHTCAFTDCIASCRLLQHVKQDDAPSSEFTGHVLWDSLVDDHGIALVRCYCQSAEPRKDCAACRIQTPKASNIARGGCRMHSEIHSRFRSDIGHTRFLIAI